MATRAISLVRPGHHCHARTGALSSPVTSSDTPWQRLCIASAGVAPLAENMRRCGHSKGAFKVFLKIDDQPGAEPSPRYLD